MACWKICTNMKANLRKPLQNCFVIDFFFNCVIAFLSLYFFWIWMWKTGVIFQGFVPRPIWVPGSFPFIAGDSGLKRNYTELWQKNSRPLSHELVMTFQLHATSTWSATPRISSALEIALVKHATIWPSLYQTNLTHAYLYLQGPVQSWLMF